MEKKYKFDIKEIEYKPYLIWMTLALALTFIVEGINRGSLNEAFVFFDENTRRFIINYLIVLAATSPCILFNKVYFIFAIIAEILLILSISSYVVFSFRGTPLTFSDFYSIMDGIAIAGQYISIAMVIGVIIVFAILFIVAWKSFNIEKSKKLKINKLSIILIPVIILLTQVSVGKWTAMGILIPNQWDIKLSYDDNGFIYSFYNSYKSYKREAPQNYTKKTMSDIKNSIEKSSVPKNKEENPNIIVLQIESVMDPLDIEGTVYSEDPMKNIRSMIEKYSSGLLQVPTIGGGTARTEFEVMTGISMDYMSPGEIPHNNDLKKQPVESMAYVLDGDKYDKTFIHNFEGNFYGRNLVYENLGFEKYIPMEYMYDLQYSGAYPKDEAILRNIQSVLESTEKKDLIFAIGVQTHGGYYTEYDNKNSKVKVSGDLDEKDLNQIQHFVDNLVDVDEVLGQLVQYVENLEEPTILAVYSDHLPALDIVNKTFDKEKKYLTPYFICDNMGLEKEDMNLEAYELSTRLLNLAQLDGGIMNKFHNYYRGSEDYKKNLELIQYDILSGEKYITDKKNMYKKTRLTMGLYEIIIDNVTINENIIEVNGSGFNQFSVININGKPVDTVYIDDKILQAQISSKIKLEKETKITVSQVSRYSKAIGTTKPYKIIQ